MNGTYSIRPALLPTDPKGVSLQDILMMISGSLNAKWAHIIQKELQIPHSRFSFEVSDLLLRRTGALAPALQVTIHSRGMRNNGKAVACWDPIALSHFV